MSQPTIAAPIESQHVLLYTTKEPVTARALAESLIGLEGVVLSCRGALEVVMGKGSIKDMDVLISGIRIGSYEENFIVRLIFGKGKKAQANIDQLRKDLGLDKMETKKVVGWVIAAAVIYSAYLWVKPAADKEASIHIENSFNSIGAEASMTGDQVLKMMEAVFGKTREKELKKRAPQLVHPGGNAHSGEMSLDGNSSLTISKEVLKAIPPQPSATPDEDPVEDFEAIQIVVRAADLDNSTRGWSAIVPEIEDRRLPMHLLPEVDPNKVPVGKYCHADITVVYATKAGAKRKAKQLLLRKVYGEDEELPAEPKP